MIAKSAIKNDSLNKEIIEWAYSYLLSHGYNLLSNQVENVQDTPWSYVVRFATTEGYIYLKHTPELLALEATIIQIFHSQFNASVPKIIANNPKLHCFLMQDAGESLRKILKQKFDEALLCKAIDQFTSLQIAVADHVDVFLDVGVPDWRLDKIPHLYKEMIAQNDLLIADGLSEAEIVQLEGLIPTVSNVCKKLSTYSIKQTFVQPDFNDNNTLIDEISQTITIIDLGEITISHPFFSLLNCLQQIKKHYSLTNKDAIYNRIKDSCFKNYVNFESKDHLLEALSLTNTLFFIYGALSNYRLINACDKTKFTSAFQLQGRISVMLKAFIARGTGRP